MKARTLAHTTRADFRTTAYAYALAMSDHVERNIREWDRWSPDWVEPGRRDWSRPEITWGSIGARESELGLLGDVENKDVLELGCGTAYFSSWLMRRGARVVGLDVSSGQLATEPSPSVTHQM